MRWCFLAIFFLSGFLWARGPFRVAVCGTSRSVEELELALELNPQVLVQKCGDKKLDARVSFWGKQIEVYAGDKLLFAGKHAAGIQRFIGALLRKLSEKPKVVLVKPVLLPVAPPIENQIPPDPPFSKGGELDAEVIVEGQKLSWQLESLASVDQWSSGLSTRAYPGAQIRSDVRFLSNWHIEGQFAFGASAFRIGDQVAWNQQLLGGLLGSWRADLSRGFWFGPQAGYFYWVSLSDFSELPSFQRHDAQIGAQVLYELKHPNLEFSGSASFLPVHLGLQGQVAIRYYFAPNWYASLQGRSVNLWAENSKGAFLSASLGLGCAL